jgi:hypothetical protein
VRTIAPHRYALMDGNGDGIHSGDQASLRMI